MGRLRNHGKPRKSEHFLGTDYGIERSEARVISENPFGGDAPFHQRQLHALDFVVIAGRIVSRNQQAVHALFAVKFGRRFYPARKIGVRASIGSFRGRSENESDGVFGNGVGFGKRPVEGRHFHAQVRNRGKTGGAQEGPCGRLPEYRRKALEKPVSKTLEAARIPNCGKTF